MIAIHAPLAALMLLTMPVEGDGPVASRREMALTARYLHLPVQNGAPKRRMTLAVDGRPLREFEIELAVGKPDFWTFADLQEYRGRTLVVSVDAPPAGDGLAATVLAETIPDPDGAYRERLRPQFHFSSRRGWLNDPNGLVYQDGEYHLFYQHNPYGREWGNMHWGHAVSPDLVRWRELPIALYPRRFGDWAFSGSAVVDRADTGGFGAGGKAAMVLAFTSTGRGECIASSLDGGRTWSEFAGNPVVKHVGRDPKLLWHEPTRRWIMAVYDEGEGRRSIDFYASPDLKAWTYLSRSDGYFECPDLFPLAVDGDPGRVLWVLHAADGRYALGDFDGTAFREWSGRHALWHGDFYAAQSFSDAPDGRRIQIGWARGAKFPGMPFNQRMTVPVSLSLRSTAEGPRLFAEPVKELEGLRRRALRLPDATLRDEGRALEGCPGDLLSIRLAIEPAGSASAGITVLGVPIAYDSAARRLRCGGVEAPLQPADGGVRLQILVDRGAIEVFAGDGRVAISVGAVPPEAEGAPTLFARGGQARFHSVEVDEMGSIWSR